MAIGDILREPDVGRSIDRVERPYDRGDVEAILNAPFYIGANVKDIRDHLLEDEDGEEEEEAKP
jgi:hypothetical protein